MTIKTPLPLEGFDLSRSPSPDASPGASSTRCSTPASDVYESDEASEVSTQFENSPVPEPTTVDAPALSNTFGPGSNVGRRTTLFVDRFSDVPLWSVSLALPSTNRLLRNIDTLRYRLEATFMAWSWASPWGTDIVELYSIHERWKIPSGRINYIIIDGAESKNLWQVVVKATCTSTHAELGENTQRRVPMLLK